MEYNIFPETIKKIAVIAPAGPIDNTRLKRSYDMCQSIPCEIILPTEIFDEKYDVHYLSAPAENRVALLHKYWKNPDIDMIMAAKGGFGSIHLLPLINWNILLSRDVTFIGYSDISALQLAFFAKGVKRAISGPMFQNLSEIEKDSFTCDSLYHSITNRDKPHMLTHFRGNKKFKVIKKGSCDGKIIPVTLSVLVAQLGTEFFPDLNDCILLLEDINEPVYKLDRYFSQLEMAGVLGKISGLLLGSFYRCGSLKDRVKLFNKIAKKVNGPVIGEVPFGHVYPRLSIPFGGYTTVDDNRIYLSEN